MSGQGTSRGYQEPEQHAGSGERVARRSAMATRRTGGESAARERSRERGDRRGRSHPSPAPDAVSAAASKGSYATPTREPLSTRLRK